MTQRGKIIKLSGNWWMIEKEPWYHHMQNKKVGDRRTVLSAWLLGLDTSLLLWLGLTPTALWSLGLHQQFPWVSQSQEPDSGISSLHSYESPFFVINLSHMKRAQNSLFLIYPKLGSSRLNFCNSLSDSLCSWFTCFSCVCALVHVYRRARVCI